MSKVKELRMNEIKIVRQKDLNFHFVRIKEYTETTC